MKRFQWAALALAALATFGLVATKLQARSMTERATAKHAPPVSGNLDKIAQDSVLRELEAGNYRFRKAFAKETVTESKGTVTGPKAMVLACSDPRVIPERIFNAKPGELFVVRVAGNIAADEAVASLEYGAEILNIPVLVVLGHQNCTVVKACLDARSTPDPFHTRSFVRLSLYKHLTPACEEAEGLGLRGDALWNKAIEANVRNAIREVLENSPSMWNLHLKGKLRVVGALYSKESGQVYWLDK